VIFGLRLDRGIPTDQLNKHADNYGCSIAVDELRAQNLLEETDDRTRLSVDGRLHADTVAEKLF
jgi:coproporphyrinogen III oxidase-like Fe-S oxidoreductase